MQRIFDNCKDIIEECFASSFDTYLHKHKINFMRDYVKDEIKRRRIVDSRMKYAFSEVEIVYVFY
jgi:predicted HD phosphohydrolase